MLSTLIRTSRTPFARAASMKLVEVFTHGQGPMTVTKAGKFELFTDNPAPAGSDLGPSPLHLTLSGLAACKNVTAGIVAKQKKFALGDIHFTTAGEIDLDGIMGKGVPTTFHKIEMLAEVEGDLSDADVQVLATEVNARCPVAVLFEKAGCEMNVTWKKM